MIRVLDSADSTLVGWGRQQQQQGLNQQLAKQYVLIDSNKPTKTPNKPTKSPNKTSNFMSFLMQCALKKKKKSD